jgi:hypothetical protein
MAAISFRCQIPGTLLSRTISLDKGTPSGVVPRIPRVFFDPVGFVHTEEAANRTDHRREHGGVWCISMKSPRLQEIVCSFEPGVSVQSQRQR